MDKKTIERRKRFLNEKITAIKEGKIAFSTRIINKPEPIDTGLMRYTFEKAGRHYAGSKTFEQWERGFLRERNMKSEIRFWVLLTFFLIDRKLEGEEAKQAAGRFCAASFIRDPNDKRIQALERIAKSEGFCERVANAANEGLAMLSR